MTPTWTVEQIERVMSREREDVMRRRRGQTRGRIDAVRVVQDAIRKADDRYRQRYDAFKRDLEIGIIGPEGQPHKQNREAWLAAEVRYSLLRELYAESPIRREDDATTDQ